MPSAPSHDLGPVRASQAAVDRAGPGSSTGWARRDSDFGASRRPRVLVACSRRRAGTLQQR